MTARAGLALAALFLAGILAACGPKNPGVPLPPNLSQVVTVTERADLAPDFTWEDPDGAEMSFDRARGTVTLVNFWATWCGPCRKEMPDLVELSQAYADRGFRVIGIATDRTANAAELVAEFIREYKIPYQIVLSTQEVEDAFNNVRMMPTSFLVDADGRIVRTMVGLRSRAQFEEAITPLL